MADGTARWEIPELIAALDSGIAGRLKAQHPGSGWCWRCRVSAPCPSRQLAVAIEGIAGF